MSLLFTLGDHFVKITDEALGVLNRYRQKKPRDLEAAGVLLGRIIKGSFALVVDEVTEPMPGDERSRYGVTRGQAGHQEVMDERWKSSGGTCIYLGEWHTHPEPIPTPSPLDLSGWHFRLHNDNLENFEVQLFMIVGTEEIGLWEGDRVTKKIHKMKYIES